MSTRYRIVHSPSKGYLSSIVLEGRAALDAWVAKHGLAVVGEKRQRGSIALAPEIVGQPIIGGFHGPMKDSDAVRYESADAYDLLTA